MAGWSGAVDGTAVLAARRSPCSSAFPRGAPIQARALAPDQAPTPTPSPTIAPWQPDGAWQLVHGPGRDPLLAAPRPGTPAPALLAVHGAAGDQGAFEAWAVGERCAVAAWDGAAWRRVPDLEPACDGLRAIDLRDVFVRAPGDAWAVGRLTSRAGAERDCVAAEPASPGDVDHPDGCGALARLEGGAWRLLDLEALGAARPLPALNALDLWRDPATGLWHGWAVGNDADFDPGKAIILAFEDDGAGGRWRRSDAPNNLADDLRAVKVLSAGEAWAAGESGTESWYRANAAGEGDWSRRGLSGRDHLYALDLTDPLYGWDGGWRGRLNRYGGSCHDADPATACWFDNQAYPIRNLEGQAMTGSDVLGIDLVARGVGWLVGERDGRRSLIAHLSGERWQQVVVADDPGVDLHGVFMAGEDRGWAVGREGVILAYGPPAEPTASATTTPTSMSTPTRTATPVAPSSTATATRPPSSSPTATATSIGPPPTADATLPATASAEPMPSPMPPALCFVPFAMRRR